MKNLLVATLVALFSVSAFATKARLNSLGNARHLLDTQSIWNNPTDVYTSGDWISVEAGNNTDSYNTGGATVPAQVKAEGGMVQTTSFGKIGVFYGHRSDSSNQLVGAGNALILTAAKAVPLEQNPLDILWAKELGGLKTAFGLHYTDSKSDSFAGIAGSPSVKQSTLGAYGGVRGDVWDAYLRVGLGGTSKNETANTEIKATGYVKVGGRYNVDTITYFGDVTSASANATGGTPADAKAEIVTLNVGMVNNHKMDAGSFFYGLSYFNDSQTLKVATDQKNTISSLPLIVGMEIDAASWLVLRGSVAQSLLLNDTKKEFGATIGKTTTVNDTVVAAGLGMKFNKFLVDGTLTAAGNGNLNTVTLLANTAVTYNF